MISPEQQDSSAMNPTLLATPDGSDEGQRAEETIRAALAGFEEMRGRPVAEHVERFEAVHAALTDALNKAENFLSGSSGNES